MDCSFLFNICGDASFFYKLPYKACCAEGFGVKALTYSYAQIGWSAWVLSVEDKLTMEIPYNL